MRHLIEKRESRFLLYVAFIFGAATISFAFRNPTWVSLVTGILILAEMMGVKEWWRG